MSAARRPPMPAARSGSTAARAAACRRPADLQGLLKSGLVTWLSGARRRVGLGSREGSRLLMTDVVPTGGEVARISSGNTSSPSSSGYRRGRLQDGNHAPAFALGNRMN